MWNKLLSIFHTKSTVGWFIGIYTIKKSVISMLASPSFFYIMYIDSSVYMCVWERRMLLCGIRIFNLFFRWNWSTFLGRVCPLCQIPFYFSKECMKWIPFVLYTKWEEFYRWPSRLFIPLRLLILDWFIKLGSRHDIIW